MKIALLSTCALLMAATPANAAQDAMSSNDMSATAAPAAMTPHAKGMAKTGKTKKAHSKNAMKKPGADAKSDNKMSH